MINHTNSFDTLQFLNTQLPQLQLLHQHQLQLLPQHQHQCQRQPLYLLQLQLPLQSTRQPHCQWPLQQLQSPAQLSQLCLKLSATTALSPTWPVQLPSQPHWLPLWLHQPTVPISRLIDSFKLDWRCDETKRKSAQTNGTRRSSIKCNQELALDRIRYDWWRENDIAQFINQNECTLARFIVA